MVNVEQYYNDTFALRLLRDYIYGNRRVDRIRKFLTRAIPSDTRSILEIGCGSGANAYWLSRKVARRARILAVDVSSANIRVANEIFHGPRVRFAQCNILEQSLEERNFDVIILPDVYEHIPIGDRPKLHTALDRYMSENARLLLTVPSPGAQDAEERRGIMKQIVDETVTLEDMMQLARDVRGTLTYYSMVSIGYTNEYVHIMIERDVGPPRPLSAADMLPIKMSEPYRFRTRLWRRLVAVGRKTLLYPKLRRMRTWPGLSPLS